MFLKTTPGPRLSVPSFETQLCHLLAEKNFRPRWSLSLVGSPDSGLNANNAFKIKSKNFKYLVECKSRKGKLGNCKAQRQEGAMTGGRAEARGLWLRGKGSIINGAWQLSGLMSQREPGLASQDKTENRKGSHEWGPGSLHPIPGMAPTWALPWSVGGNSMN